MKVELLEEVQELVGGKVLSFATIPGDEESEGPWPPTDLVLIPILSMKVLCLDGAVRKVEISQATDDPTLVGAIVSVETAAPKPVRVIDKLRLESVDLAEQGFRIRGVAEESQFVPREDVES